MQSVLQSPDVNLKVEELNLKELKEQALSKSRSAIEPEGTYGFFPRDIDFSKVIIHWPKLISNIEFELNKIGSL